MTRTMQILSSLVLFLFALILGPSAFALPDTPRTLRIYLDADRYNNFASARSIEMGVSAAFSHSDLLPEGVELEVVPMDHRGNAKRSFKNFLTFEKDPNALAIVGGMHSPPYLAYRDTINERGLLLLLAWSAGGPITRGQSENNWIFRVSVDDTKAGPFLANSAVKAAGCTDPALLILNSGWGRFNLATMSDTLADLGIANPTSILMDEEISGEMATIIARDIVGSDADCLIYVGHTRGGADVFNVLVGMDSSIRVFSHWGITDGDFLNKVSPETRADL